MRAWDAVLHPFYLLRRGLHWCGGWLRTVGAAVRRSPGRFVRLAVALGGLAVVGYGVFRLARPEEQPRATPVMPDAVPPLLDTGSLGVRVAAAAVVLFGIRTVLLEVVAYFRNGPLEVQPLRNATGEEWNMAALEVAFHQDMARPRLYPITTVPGDRDPDRLIEILTPRGSGSDRTGWRDLVRSAYGYAVPTRAFLVEATVRRRSAAPHYGVAVRVRHLPQAYVELDTVWSTDPERALQRAAYSIGAYVLPRTKACRSAPWTDWQTKRIPPQLFRGYHRAKRMIHERRYDEALQLYRTTVKADADNVVMRYEMGQLFERLRLYADALDTYAQLMRVLFPPTRRAGRGTRALRRVTFPRWWPSGTSGPYDVRYRYVSALGASDDLVRELCRPDWPELLPFLAPPGPGPRPAEEHQPLRALEVLDLRRRLGEVLDPWAPYVAAHWPDEAGPAPARTFSALVADGYEREESRHLVAVYLLVCARAEAAALTRSFARVVGGRPRRATWSLTVTGCREVELLLTYKLERAVRLCAKARTPTPPATSTRPEPVADGLRRRGYRPHSRYWLEHYLTACVYSVSLTDDVAQVEEHRADAERAVDAIESAERFGDDISFITAKEFWIVAGDPDLAGLRFYDCFRAFELRVYSRPLPAVRNLARYERYAFLLAMLRQAAQALEERWRDRAQQAPGPGELEEHWSQELYAWQLAVRLGRFYRQWQTRQHVHQVFRRWSESAGHEMTPITYPNVAREWYAPYTSSPAGLERRLKDTEQMFAGLGALGLLDPASGPRPADAGSVLHNTRLWLHHAQTRGRTADVWANSPFAAAARAREGLWAALRHWAESPGDAAPFAATARDLPRPPAAGRLSRRS